MNIIIFINRKNILIFLLLLLLYIFNINCRKIDNSLDYNLSLFQPILSNPEMKPLISSCHIVFNYPKWYKNLRRSIIKNRYNIFICQLRIN